MQILCTCNLTRAKRKEVVNISVIKKSVIHLRRSLRLFILFGIATAIIIGILALFFKKAYIVTYNGEFISSE